MSRAGSTPYKVAAIAGRQALDRARGLVRTGDLKGFDFLVLVALVELMPLYSKLSDQVGTRQLEQMLYGEVRITDYERRNRIGRSLRRLNAHGIIVIETGKGRNARTRVRFPEPGADAQGSGEKPGADAQDYESTPAPDFADEPGADDHETRRASPRNPARASLHSEKYPEKTPEKNSREKARTDGDVEIIEPRDLETAALAHFAIFIERGAVTETEIHREIAIARARDIPDAFIADAIAGCEWPSDLVGRLAKIDPAVLAVARAHRVAERAAPW